MGPEYPEELCLGPQVVKNPHFVLALGLDTEDRLSFFLFKDPSDYKSLKALLRFPFRALFKCTQKAA